MIVLARLLWFVMLMVSCARQTMLMLMRTRFRSQYRRHRERERSTGRQDQRGEQQNQATCEHPHATIGSAAYTVRQWDKMSCEPPFFVKGRRNAPR